MYRFAANLGRVIRQQFQTTAIKGTNKEEVRKSKNGLVVYRQSEKGLIRSRYSSFSNEEYGYGPDRERWYNPHGEYWWFNGDGRTAFEAFGLGAAVVFGIHLKPLINLLLSSDRRTDLTHCPSVLLALGSPGAPRPEPKAQQENQTEPESIDDSMFQSLKAKFTRLVDDYRGGRENAIAGRLYEVGKHVDAVLHWKRASMHGSAAAMYNLGLCYEHGIGVTPNEEKSLRFYKMAVANDHPVATYQLALLYAGGEEISSNMEALQLMKQAAVLGFADAQLYMGTYYTRGSQRDMTRAAEMFTLAAKQKNVDALYMLGICYERGWGVSQNERIAVELYHKASLSSHARATYNLAVMHELGSGGLPQNQQAALDLYKKALHLGHQPAQSDIDRLDSHCDQPQTSCNVNKTRTLPISDSSPTLYSTSTKIRRNVTYVYKAFKRCANTTAQGRSPGRSPVRFFIGDDTSDSEDVVTLTKAASTDCIPKLSVIDSRT